MIQEIIIEGKPIPQKRPEFRRFGKFVQTYDPSSDLKKKFKEQLKLRDLVVMEGAISFVLKCFMPIPTSLSEKKKELLDQTAHTQRPDCDNIFKFYSDCLNEICYKDDSQLSHIEVYKTFDRRPRVEITLTNI